MKVLGYSIAPLRVWTWRPLCSPENRTLVYLVVSVSSFVVFGYCESISEESGTVGARNEKKFDDVETSFGETPDYIAIGRRN